MMRNTTSRVRRPRARRALTLVELLIVIAIITILFTVSIPLMKPAFKDRKIREATRVVNAYIGATKARAAELNRPVGLWIERSAENAIGTTGTGVGARTGATLYMGEVAEAYTGDTLEARAWVEDTGGVRILRFTPASPITPHPHVASLYALVRRDPSSPFGETFLIKFDYKGSWYQGQRVENPSAPGNLNADVFVIAVTVPPPGTELAPGQKFQVRRFPVRSTVAPVTLPGDVVIDLSVSGTSATGNEFDAVEITPGNYEKMPVIVMFNPGGTVDAFFTMILDPVTGRPDYRAFPPSGPIHLLIGRITQIADPRVAPSPNLADTANFWVSINNRTGQVTSSENAGVAGALSNTTPDQIRAARDIARSAVRAGGA